MQDPSLLSRYLAEHKTNPRLLYCYLTKKNVRNTYEDAYKHIDGAYFVHKSYERIRRLMVAKYKKPFVQKMTMARKLIDLNRMKKLRMSSRKDRLSEYNVLLKGFPRRDKLRGIIRFSRLLVLGMKGWMFSARLLIYVIFVTPIWIAVGIAQSSSHVFHYEESATN